MAGLTTEEASKRLEQFGLNSVAEEHPRGISMFFLKFWGLIPWMLELSVILDILLGRYAEATVMTSLLVFNAIIGFIHENKAQEALALLREHLSVTTRILRDGHWQEIPASGVVPDDVIRLRVGDIVPADIRIVDGVIQVDQSQLTGESLPVERTIAENAYAGSTVSRGEVTGVVTATGARTYFGKTAELVRTAEAPRHLELLILHITKYLAGLVIILSIAVFAAAIIHGTPLRDILPFSLILLVASVPVTLPIMFTMSAALGARALTKNGILVTRLSAIEDAASMDVLCVDKTGTLTENHLTVGEIFPFNGISPDEVLRVAALASDEATQDSIDLAILRSAREKDLIKNIPQYLQSIPFDPSTKRSEVRIKENEQVVRIIKGAPVTLAKLSGVAWSEIAEEVSRLSIDGSRIIAVAKGVDSDMHLVGLLALNDPPRADSLDLIANLLENGVRVILITGDGEATAQAIATKVGITGQVAPAGVLRNEINIDVVTRFNIFSGVLPEDKFALVQALQKAGHIVGMTGDGVNDAPALRQADVGIAVSSATDVAKAAASLVLTRTGLNEIVVAIGESRRIHQRIQTWIMAMITRKIVIPPFLAIWVIFFNTFALNPLLIVLLMFATDVITMSISTDNVTPSPSPNRWNMRALLLRVVGPSTLLMLFSMVVYWVATTQLQLTITETQTVIFLWLVFGSAQAILYLTRTQSFFWRKPYPGRWIIITSLFDISIVTLLATQGWLMSKISIILVCEIFIFAILFLFVADLLKVVMITWGSKMKHTE